MGNSESTARGPSADFCPAHDASEPHHMVSKSAGKLVRWIEQCSLCGWIDNAALDGWAENAVKNALSERAQNIAVSIGTEPFAFVQREGAELTLEDVLLQAFAAVTAASQGAGDGGYDINRMQQIFARTRGELVRFQQLAMNEARSHIRQRVSEQLAGMPSISRSWADLILSRI